jgi:transcriptional regulator with XRE-family HTH domain
MEETIPGMFLREKYATFGILTPRSIKDHGESIKSRRLEAGLTQDELAELVGVTVQSVHRWENGRSKIRISNIRKLERAFQKVRDEKEEPAPAPKEPPPAPSEKGVFLQVKRLRAKGEFTFRTQVEGDRWVIKVEIPNSNQWRSHRAPIIAEMLRAQLEIALEALL